MKGIMMITWLLLVSLFCQSTQNGNGQENGVLHCGSQNLTRTGVFPKDHNFTVGSNATFCCVLAEGEVFVKMYLEGYSNDTMQTTNISNLIYALTVHLKQPSNLSPTNVMCEIKKKEEYGACAYIGYPPDVSGLQCETQNLKSVQCQWTEGKDKDNLRATIYQLIGRKCTNEPKGRCTQEADVIGERNWTLTAQNRHGRGEFSETADLTKRVRMYRPEEVKVSSVNARNVSLEWGWTVPEYNNLNITCQVNTGYAENTIRENFGVGLRFVVLTELIPYWEYNVTVRCGTTQHFWKWSDWSSIVNIHTKGDVPDALDVWRVGQPKDNQIKIIWKTPLANQSHGNIKDYEVTWTKTTEGAQQHRTNVPLYNRSLTLSLETEEYIVTVTARNINGSSSPSTITIPCLNPMKKVCIKDIYGIIELSSCSDRTTSWIIGRNGSFDLSWSASPISSCGYIVDWCLTVGCEIVEWMKVPPNDTKVSISSKNFEAGLRYSLSIHACTQGAPVLLEEREGYIKEERIQDKLFKPLKGKQQDYNYVVSWDPISFRKQTAFISGYVLYYFDNNNSISVFNVSTEDLNATSLTARNLTISGYTFTVKAKTAVGECGDTHITASLNPLEDDLIKTVFISLATVFGLLSLITILFYRHWTCIKQKVYPPIPKPVLTSPDEHRCPPLVVDHCHDNEADIVDVLEIHCSTGAPMNGSASQTNIPFVFAQIQPLKKCTPPPLTLPTTAIPSESGLSSPFRRVFPNPSYNLIIQQGYHSNSGPELQERKSLERCSSGYQAQDYTEPTINQTEEDADSPLSCVSTYILLPQSPSR